jgi:hypothetical protein
MKNMVADSRLALLALNTMVTDKVLSKPRSLKTPYDQLYDSCIKLVTNSTPVFGPLTLPYFGMLLLARLCFFFSLSFFFLLFFFLLFFFLSLLFFKLFYYRK